MSKPASDDERSAENAQDTPGRPNSTASRQQTQHDQGGNTGNPQLDSQGDAKPPHSHHVRNEK